MAEREGIDQDRLDTLQVRFFPHILAAISHFLVRLPEGSNGLKQKTMCRRILSLHHPSAHIEHCSLGVYACF